MSFLIITENKQVKYNKSAWNVMQLLEAIVDVRKETMDRTYNIIW